MREAIKGLELSRRFYEEVVKPILVRDYPNLDYAPSLIGSIDQFSDNTDLREYMAWRNGVRQSYESVL